MASITTFTGSIPANYDRYLGPLLFEPYALDITERIRKGKPRQVLELACGTGRVTKHLASLLPENGQLVATDLNRDMISIARSKLPDGHVQWREANALDLPFEDDRFDHIVCQFGFMFFPDKEKSLVEARRVLRKGGRYVFNVWESVEKNPRIETITKVIREVFQGDAPDFFQKGPYSFYDKGLIEDLLARTGFNDIQIDTVTKTTSYNEPDDLIRGFADGSTLYNFLAEKDKNIQDRFRQLLRDRLLEQEQIYGNSVPSSALVIEATK